jgi:hypothetical protein
LDSVSTTKIYEEEERMRTPRMPGPSAEEQAMTIRQRKALDKEIAENEARLKRAVTGRAGKGSLLGMAGMDDELGGGARGTGGISSTLFGAGDKGVPGGRTITPGFIKSTRTGETLKIPNSAVGGRQTAQAERFTQRHGGGTGTPSKMVGGRRVATKKKGSTKDTRRG